MCDKIKEASKNSEDFSEKDREREAIERLNEMDCLTISFKDYFLDLQGRFKKSDEEIKKMMKIIEDFKSVKILQKNSKDIERFLHELKKNHPVESIGIQAESILESLNTSDQNSK